MEFRSWSEGASFPLLPSADSARVFIKLRQHPRLDAAPPAHRIWRARPATEFHHGRQASLRARPMREFDATNDKHHFDFGRPDDAMWPVYKGASFNLWEPDTGTY
jgi:hypothetical protein